MNFTAQLAARAMAADETIPMIEVVLCVPPQTTTGAQISLFKDRKRFQKREHAAAWIAQNQHIPQVGIYLAMIKGTRKQIEDHPGFTTYTKILKFECEYGGKMAHQCEWEIVQTIDTENPPLHTVPVREDNPFMFGTKEAAEKALDFMSRHCLLTKPGHRLVIKHHDVKQ